MFGTEAIEQFGLRDIESPVFYGNTKDNRNIVEGQMECLRQS